MLTRSRTGKERAMAAVLCRICLSTAQPKHSTALFNERGLTLKWSDRLGELLRVPVIASDDLPDHICRHCRQKVERLEGKLTSLRQQTRKSYERLSHEPTTRKRPKHTSSSLGVSPGTANARPPAKRSHILIGKQLFSSENEECLTG